MQLPLPDLDEIDRLARDAVTHVRVGFLDTADRYQLAWSAIAEASLTQLDPRRLAWAGRNAIYDAAKDYWHDHGLRKGRGSGLDAVPASRAMQFWWDWAGVVPGHEHGVVERVAVWQVWQRLWPVDRQALAALAVHGDYQAAAAALGLEKTTFHLRVQKARRRFYRWWHEGEVPSRPFAVDRRAATDSVRVYQRTRPSSPLEGVSSHGQGGYRQGCGCDVCYGAVRAQWRSVAKRAAAGVRRRRRAARGTSGGEAADAS